MKRLSKQQVIRLHDMLLKNTGGLPGIRDDNLLESALSMPFITFDGRSLYSTVEEKAARLAYGLVKNHPFADGNKRIGILVMMVFLEINGIDLVCSDDDLINLGLSLATGDLTEYDLFEWITTHS